MSKLVRSHRTMGYETGRARMDDGREVAILRTAPHKLEASLAHMLIPVSPDEVAFEVRMALAAAIERARFLGLDPATLRQLVEEELERAGDA